jgi:hypothetical protein
MSTYLYELPTTGATSFADFCTDETSSYAAHISRATQARADLRGALKESKRDHGEKDYLKLIKVCCSAVRCESMGLGYPLYPRLSMTTSLNCLG